MARILTAAGFTDIVIAPFDASVPFGEGATRDAAIEDAVKMTFEVGPLSRVLADQPDDIRGRGSCRLRGPRRRAVGDDRRRGVDRYGAKSGKLTGMLDRDHVCF